MIESYWWDFWTTIHEYVDIIDIDRSLWSDLDAALANRIIEARIEFVDNSRLVVSILLSVSSLYQVTEQEYYYGYYGRDGQRLFSYDNTPHHPEIDPFPHHMHKGPQPKVRNTAYPVDILPTFSNVLAKIRNLVSHIE